MSQGIKIPDKVLNGISERALANPGEEICGAILRGEDIPVDNVTDPGERSWRFRMDPDKQMEIWRDWGLDGDLVIYHSHPKADSIPSANDKWVISRSPDITFLIFSNTRKMFRAYRWADMKLTEVNIDAT